MSVAARLGAFAVVVAVSFSAAYAVGTAVGDTGGSSDTTVVSTTVAGGAVTSTTIDGTEAPAHGSEHGG